MLDSIIQEVIIGSVDFIDRNEELQRLDALWARPEGGLAVLWGRRRVGKTRLLLEWTSRHDGLYTVADQSAAPLQRAYFAHAIGTRFAGFDAVTYPDWRSLLARLAEESVRAGWRGPLVLDEMPHLAGADKAFASVLQNWIDHAARSARLVVALAGSSQKMMHGAVLDAEAPLYGRAAELLQVRPLSPGYLVDAFGGLAPRSVVELYAHWGGVPRYWELATSFGSDVDSSVERLVLDPSGPLHTEPDRLLMEETPSATALRPLLDLIGAGVHRLSEIAGRLGQPATSLSRPLKRLVELDLVRREQPFGESPREGKRSLYRICDPFMRFWFAVVAANRSLLTEAPPDVRLSVWRSRRPALEAQTWEELCRGCVPRLHTTSLPVGALGPWMPAQRYWRGGDLELDIVARSADGSRLLIGESKWLSAPVDSGVMQSLSSTLLNKGTSSLAVPEGVEVVRAVFVPEAAPGMRPPDGVYVVDAASVVAALR
jgi:hypothetical protein